MVNILHQRTLLAGGSTLVSSAMAAPEGPPPPQDLEHPPFPDTEDDVHPPAPDDAAALMQVRCSTAKAAEVSLSPMRRLAVERHVRDSSYVA
eukprot:1260113-Pyramimonas_sp.AAC.1